MNNTLYKAHVKQSLEDLLVVAESIVNERLMLIAEKTIGQVVASYDDNLTNLVYDDLNRRIDAIDMRRAHKAMIRSYAPKV